MYYFMYDDHNSKNKAILGQNEYERDICENCGAIHVKYKGVFNFRIMGKLYDYYSASGTFVISETFLNVLKKTVLRDMKSVRLHHGSEQQQAKANP